MPGCWRNATEIVVGGYEDQHASMQGVKGGFEMASQEHSLIGFAIDGCTAVDSAEYTSGCHLGVSVVGSCHVFVIPLGHSRDNSKPVYKTL
jgi:hypothetical protein